MTDKYESLPPITREQANTAKHYCDFLATHASVAWYAESYQLEWHLAQVVAHLTKAADALGFNLVPRLSPQVAHEALLAARVAEDGPAPVADIGARMDSRADSGGRMDLASIGECPGEIARAAIAAEDRP